MMAATKKRARGCKCIALAQKTIPIATLPVNGQVPRAVLRTERLEIRRDGKRAAMLVAAYCPFCGEEYPS